MDSKNVNNLGFILNKKQAKFDFKDQFFAISTKANQIHINKMISPHTFTGKTNGFGSKNLNNLDFILNKTKPTFLHFSPKQTKFISIKWYHHTHF